MLAWMIAILVNNLELIPLSLLFLFIFGYSYITKKWELFWLISYYLFFFNSLLFILFFYADFILIYFLDQVLEPIVISDPTTFTYNYFCFIMYLNFLLSIPFLLFLIFFFILSLTYNYNYISTQFLYLWFIFVLKLIFWLTKYDFFFSNWFSLGYMPKFATMFDFQPQFENFLNIFWVEYQEFLVFYLCLVFIPFFFILRGNLKYNQIRTSILGFFFSINILFIYYYLFEFLFVSNFILSLTYFFLFFILRVFWLVLELTRRHK